LVIGNWDLGLFLYMEHINRQLNINLNKRGLKNIADSAYICFLFEKLKASILGKEIQAEAISFKNNILKIKADNSVAASEIRFRADQIKKAINDKVGKNIIAKIDIRVI